MNTHAAIPHRLFVAALSGARNPQPLAAGSLLHVAVDPAGKPAAASLAHKRREQAVAALATRRMLMSAFAGGA